MARAVAFASRIVFMDEPTAALGVVQRGRVLDMISRVRDRGVSVVLISHNMPEVLRSPTGSKCCGWDGGWRASRRRDLLEELVAAMTGALEHANPRHP